MCEKGTTVFGLNPTMKIKIKRGKRIKNSLKFKSENFIVWEIFKFPNKILLQSHKEYAPQNITPKQEITLAVPLNLKTPNKRSSSPIKLLVPGKAIFAIVKIKKKEEYKGIKWTIPP